ncbi:type II toxin-antitoxin system Phd/YefM family antitoxin [Streptomyces sp. NPDC017529]|uniref:type II toxin-antitoxin system Phd/YefM family antitoxin n=1 Tax=Streptomyces sp. NPDC017529 TaxID=3365000 RepID=UPI00379B9312
MAYEIPVTQARAELADLINRVVYAGERVVVTRHGKPLVGLVSAADLERLEAYRAAEEAAAEEQVISTVSVVRPFASPPGEWRRFGIAAEHRGTAGDRGATGEHGGPGAGER